MCHFPTLLSWHIIFSFSFFDAEKSNSSVENNSCTKIIHSCIMPGGVLSMCLQVIQNKLFSSGSVGQLTFVLPWVPGLPQRTSLSVSQSGSWGESSVTEQKTVVRLWAGDISWPQSGNPYTCCYSSLAFLFRRGSRGIHVTKAVDARAPSAELSSLVCVQDHDSPTWLLPQIPDKK